jgi:5-formyltetrahydrofolate cyclo-ligase
MTGASASKRAIRERVWNRLEQAGAVDPGVAGYIPGFRGANEAADRLAALPAWEDARVVKTVPDRAQYPVRLLALQQGKLVYMAVPKLAEPKPFLLLDPEHLGADPRQAADRSVAARVAPLVDVDQVRPVDLIVVGSVAVNARGARLGKGAGYSDLEFGLLTKGRARERPDSDRDHRARAAGP